LIDGSSSSSISSLFRTRISSISSLIYNKETIMEGMGQRLLGSKMSRSNAAATKD
jgi:hypothetical protein